MFVMNGGMDGAVYKRCSCLIEVDGVTGVRVMIRRLRGERYMNWEVRGD